MPSPRVSPDAALSRHGMKKNEAMRMASFQLGIDKSQPNIAAALLRAFRNASASSKVL